MYLINITPDNISRYPLHVHQNYEVMVYLEGEGYLKTEDKNYPFCPGSVIIVPPYIKHGSCSENGFKNISIEGTFENMFTSKNIITFSDNAENELSVLAKLIYRNRYKNKSYLSALCSAFTRRLILETDNKSRLLSVIDNIILKISENYYNSELDLNDILDESGYAKDYIRMQFKRLTRKTPTAFLNEVRIMHAYFLINIYGDNISLGEIAERCGYTDYVYFSKKFKQITNISPHECKTRMKQAAI